MKRRTLAALAALLLAVTVGLSGCELSLERLTNGGAVPAPSAEYTGIQDGFRYTKTTLTGQEQYLYDQLLAGLKDQAETIDGLYPDNDMIQKAIDAGAIKVVETDSGAKTMTLNVLVEADAIQAEGFANAAAAWAAFK